MSRSRSVQQPNVFSPDALRQELPRVQLALGSVANDISDFRVHALPLAENSRTLNDFQDPIYLKMW